MKSVLRRRATASYAMGLAGLVAALGWSAPAQALPLVQSDITNANPVVVTDPLRIDRTENDQFGNFYHAVIDEPTLEMKGLVNSAASIRSGTAQLDDFIFDSLTFQGLPASGAAIQFELIANGTGFIPSSIPGVGPADIDENFRLNLNMGGPPVGTDNAGVNVNFVNFGSSGVTPDTPFPIRFDLTATRMIFNGVEEPFNMNMTLAALEGAEFDFLNTARLVIDLPSGASVTSAGGFFQQAPTSVPEPSSALFILPAAAAVLVLRHRRNAYRLY